MNDDIKTLREFFKRLPHIIADELKEAEYALECIEKQLAAAHGNADRNYKRCLTEKAKAQAIEKQLADKDEVLREAASVLEFIKTALPVIQCMTGKIGLDLGEAKSIEMQKAADDALASIRKALSCGSKLKMEK